MNSKASAPSSALGDCPQRPRQHRSPEGKRGLAPQRSAGACPHFPAPPAEPRPRSPEGKRGLAPQRSAGACPHFPAPPTERLPRSPEGKRGLAPQRSAGACPHFPAPPTERLPRSGEGASGSSRGRRPLSLPTSSICSAAMRPCRSRITTAAPAGACSQGDCLPRACRSAFGGSPAPWAKRGNPPSAGATAGRRISARHRRATVLSPGRDTEGGEPWVCGSVSQQAPSGATVGCRSAASPANRYLRRCG